MKIEIFDCTLREGVQSQGISMSNEDRLKIAKKLDELGISYIEAGNPASNPKETAFFKELKSENFINSKIVAFGSTRRAHTEVSEDEGLKNLIAANTDIVTVFGKSWDFHVTDILSAELYENLNMIYDTVCYLKENGKEVFYDAEHFFDGCKHNKEYALKTLEAAYFGGASRIILCDTNGAAFPDEVEKIVAELAPKYKNMLGIHCHDDCGMAVANSISAVRGGAVMIQGTLTGCGERCGNANLATVIGNLQTKMEHNVIGENLKNLTSACVYVSDVANQTLSPNAPYVGRNAFAHKGGMHIDAVCKEPSSFEHIPPETVGNKRRILVSEVSGKSAVYSKIQRLFPEIKKSDPSVAKITRRFKELEHLGYQFEAAEGSAELVIRKIIGKYSTVFTLNMFRILSEQDSSRSSNLTTALISISVDGKSEITAVEGNGPVNALDKALRKAAEVFYPQIKNVKLLDYKVRVIDSNATASKVRVLIESADGKERWTTVGESDDVIKASWIALVDSIELKIIKDSEKEKQKIE